MITLTCDHPIFRNRFNANTATLSLANFFDLVQKGSGDHDFFQKFKASVQEYFLDHGL